MADFSRSILRACIPGVFVAAALATSGAGAQGIAGPYLAAKQAEARGDVDAAARLYAEALARDDENQALLERALIHQIAAGSISEGIALARRLEGGITSASSRSPPTA